MPIVSSGVVGGDYAGVFQNAIGAPNFTTSTERIGNTLDTKSGSVGALGFMGRFEVEVPDGATITGARLSFTSQGNQGINPKPWRAGFMATDGKWNVDGFNGTQYPTRTSIPKASVYSFGWVFIDSVWHNGGAGFDGFVSIAEPTGSAFTVGDGLASDYSLSGIVSQLQSFLDNATASDRANSASGTALPVAFQIAPDGHTAAQTQTIRTVDHPTASSRPSIEIAYTVPNAPPSSGIINALTSTTIREGKSFSAQSVGSDAEDGVLYPVWSSDLDGELASGTSTLSVTTLSVGRHTITATVTDSGGLSASSTIAVDVRSIATICARSNLAPALRSNTYLDSGVTSRASRQDATGAKSNREPRVRARGVVRPSLSLKGENE